LQVIEPAPLRRTRASLLEFIMTAYEQPVRAIARRAESVDGFRRPTGEDLV
jgi:hypothetical protein